MSAFQVTTAIKPTASYITKSPETWRSPATHTSTCTIMMGKGRGHRGHRATCVTMVTGSKNVGLPVFIVLVKFSYDSVMEDRQKLTERWTVTDEGTETSEMSVYICADTHAHTHTPRTNKILKCKHILYQKNLTGFL